MPGKTDPSLKNVSGPGRSGSKADTQDKGEKRPLLPGSSFQHTASRFNRLTLFLGLVVVIVCVLLVGIILEHIRANHLTVTTNANQTAKRGTPLESLMRRTNFQNYPQYAQLGPNRDIETLWQRPPGSVRGVLFAAHGCMHQATDFFTERGRDGWFFEACRTSNTGGCLGLPEEVQLRQTARQRGYLVVAVSGGTGSRSCWDLARDPARVKLALQHVREVERVQDLPLFAVGASSGGALMGELVSAGVQQLKCIVPQIAHITVSASYPREIPALFIHMSRDTLVAALVEADVQELKDLGVRAGQICVTPAPLTEKFLIAGGAGLSPAAAKKVIAGLHERPGLLGSDGLLLADPRKSNWRQAIASVPENEVGSLLADASMLSELMNLAFAQHEISSQHTSRFLDFCEGHSEVSLGCA